MISFARILIIAVIGFLSGCSMFGPVKTTNVTRYEINTVPSVATKKTHSVTLLVMHPETDTAYNTTQIAYSKQAYQLAYFSKNNWAEVPTDMLQQLIIQTLQNTHYYHAVLSSSSVGRYDFILSSQLLTLQQDFTRRPSVVRVTVRTQLIQANTGRIMAARQFTVVKTAPQDTPYGGVVAANRSVAALLKQLSEFCVKHSH